MLPADEDDITIVPEYGGSEAAANVERPPRGRSIVIRVSMDAAVFLIAIGAAVGVDSR